MTATSPAAGLYHGTVTHVRLRPRRHELAYRVFFLLVDLDTLPTLARRLRLLACEGAGVFSLNARDHGDGSDTPLQAQVRHHLGAASLPADGPVTMLCMPRVLGYAFNPLTVYFCHDALGRLGAVMYEVSNTFGERHSYLIPLNDHDVPVLRQSCRKAFYVSPFMDMDLRYEFRIATADGRLAVTVQAHDAEGLLLSASLAAWHRPLTDASLAARFILCPLLSLKVMAGIHWEALKIWRKGLKLRPRPKPPADPVSLAGEIAP